MGSICCGSCWSHCRRRDGDGGEKDSSKGTSYCYVNPETQTSNQTIRNISASKYPEPARRYLEEKATMYVKQLEEYRRVLQKGILPSARNLYIRWYPWSMNSRIWWRLLKIVLKYIWCYLECAKILFVCLMIHSREGSYSDVWRTGRNLLQMCQLNCVYIYKNNIFIIIADPTEFCHCLLVTELHVSCQPLTYRCTHVHTHVLYHWGRL